MLKLVAALNKCVSSRDEDKFIDLFTPYLNRDDKRRFLSRVCGYRQGPTRLFDKAVIANMPKAVSFMIKNCHYDPNAAAEKNKQNPRYPAMTAVMHKATDVLNALIKAGVDCHKRGYCKIGRDGKKVFCTPLEYAYQNDLTKEFITLAEDHGLDQRQQVMWRLVNAISLMSQGALDLINFNNCTIETRGAKILAEAISHYKPELNAIFLEECALDDQGLLAITKAITTLKNKCKISIARNQISDDALAHSLDQLNKWNLCEDINVSHIALRDHSMAKLSRWLRRGASILRSLSVSHCQIEERNQALLVDSILKMPEHLRVFKAEKAITNAAHITALLRGVKDTTRLSRHMELVAVDAETAHQDTLEELRVFHQHRAQWPPYQEDETETINSVAEQFHIVQSAPELLNKLNQVVRVEKNHTVNFIPLSDDHVLTLSRHAWKNNADHLRVLCPQDERKLSQIGEDHKRREFIKKHHIMTCSRLGDALHISVERPGKYTIVLHDLPVQHTYIQAPGSDLSILSDLNCNGDFVVNAETIAIPARRMRFTTGRCVMRSEVLIFDAEADVTAMSLEASSIEFNGYVHAQTEQYIKADNLVLDGYFHSDSKTLIQAQRLEITNTAQLLSGDFVACDADTINHAGQIHAGSGICLTVKTLSLSGALKAHVCEVVGADSIHLLPGCSLFAQFGEFQADLVRVTEKVQLHQSMVLNMAISRLQIQPEGALCGAARTEIVFAHEKVRAGQISSHGELKHDKVGTGQILSRGKLETGTLVIDASKPEHSIYLDGNIHAQQLVLQSGSIWCLPTSKIHVDDQITSHATSLLLSGKLRAGVLYIEDAKSVTALRDAELNITDLSVSSEKFKLEIGNFRVQSALIKTSEMHEHTETADIQCEKLFRCEAKGQLKIDGHIQSDHIFLEGGTDSQIAKGARIVGKSQVFLKAKGCEHYGQILVEGKERDKSKMIDAKEAGAAAASESEEAPLTADGNLIIKVENLYTAFGSYTSAVSALVRGDTLRFSAPIIADKSLTIQANSYVIHYQNPDIDAVLDGVKTAVNNDSTRGMVTDAAKLTSTLSAHNVSIVTPIYICVGGVLEGHFLSCVSLISLMAGVNLTYQSSWQTLWDIDLFSLSVTQIFRLISFVKRSNAREVVSGMFSFHTVLSTVKFIVDLLPYKKIKAAFGFVYSGLLILSNAVQLKSQIEEISEHVNDGTFERYEILPLLFGIKKLVEDSVRLGNAMKAAHDAEMENQKNKQKVLKAKAEKAQSGTADTDAGEAVNQEKPQAEQKKIDAKRTLRNVQSTLLAKFMPTHYRESVVGYRSASSTRVVVGQTESSYVQADHGTSVTYQDTRMVTHGEFGGNVLSGSFSLTGKEADISGNIQTWSPGSVEDPSLMISLDNMRQTAGSSISGKGVNINVKGVKSKGRLNLEDALLSVKELETLGSIELTNTMIAGERISLTGKGSFRDGALLTKHGDKTGKLKLGSIDLERAAVATNELELLQQGEIVSSSVETERTVVGESAHVDFKKSKFETGNVDSAGQTCFEESQVVMGDVSAHVSSDMRFVKNTQARVGHYQDVAGASLSVETESTLYGSGDASVSGSFKVSEQSGSSFEHITAQEESSVTVSQSHLMARKGATFSGKLLVKEGVVESGHNLHLTESSKATLEESALKASNELKHDGDIEVLTAARLEAKKVTAGEQGTTHGDALYLETDEWSRDGLYDLSELDLVVAGLTSRDIVSLFVGERNIRVAQRLGVNTSKHVALDRFIRRAAALQLDALSISVHDDVYATGVDFRTKKGNFLAFANISAMDVKLRSAKMMKLFDANVQAEQKAVLTAAEGFESVNSSVAATIAAVKAASIIADNTEIKAEQTLVESTAGDVKLQHQSIFQGTKYLQVESARDFIMKSDSYYDRLRYDSVKRYHGSQLLGGSGREEDSVSICATAKRDMDFEAGSKISSVSHNVLHAGGKIRGRGALSRYVSEKRKSRSGLWGWKEHDIKTTDSEATGIEIYSDLGLNQITADDTVVMHGANLVALQKSEIDGKAGVQLRDIVADHHSHEKEATVWGLWETKDEEKDSQVNYVTTVSAGREDVLILSDKEKDALVDISGADIHGRTTYLRGGHVIGDRRILENKKKTMTRSVKLSNPILNAAMAAFTNEDGSLTWKTDKSGKKVAYEIARQDPFLYAAGQLIQSKDALQASANALNTGIAAYNLYESAANLTDLAARYTNLSVECSQTNTEESRQTLSEKGGIHGLGVVVDANEFNFGNAFQLNVLDVKATAERGRFAGAELKHSVESSTKNASVGFNFATGTLNGGGGYSERSSKELSHVPLARSLRRLDLKVGELHMDGAFFKAEQGNIEIDKLEVTDHQSTYKEDSWGASASTLGNVSVHAGKKDIAKTESPAGLVVDKGDVSIREMKQHGGVVAGDAMKSVKLEKHEVTDVKDRDHQRNVNVGLNLFTFGSQDNNNANAQTVTQQPIDGGETNPVIHGGAIKTVRVGFDCKGKKKTHHPVFSGESEPTGSGSVVKDIESRTEDHGGPDISVQLDVPVGYKDPTGVKENQRPPVVPMPAGKQKLEEKAEGKPGVEGEQNASKAPDEKPEKPTQDSPNPNKQAGHGPEGQEPQDGQAKPHHEGKDSQDGQAKPHQPEGKGPQDSQDIPHESEDNGSQGAQDKSHQSEADKADVDGVSEGKDKNPYEDDSGWDMFDPESRASFLARRAAELRMSEKQSSSNSFVAQKGEGSNAQEEDRSVPSAKGAKPDKHIVQNRMTQGKDGRTYRHDEQKPGSGFKKDLWGRTKDGEAVGKFKSPQAKAGITHELDGGTLAEKTLLEGEQGSADVGGSKVYWDTSIDAKAGWSRVEKGDINRKEVKSGASTGLEARVQYGKLRMENQEGLPDAVGEFVSEAGMRVEGFIGRSGSKTGAYVELGAEVTPAALKGDVDFGTHKMPWPFDDYDVSLRVGGQVSLGVGGRFKAGAYHDASKSQTVRTVGWGVSAGVGAGGKVDVGVHDKGPARRVEALRQEIEEFGRQLDAFREEHPDMDHQIPIYSVRSSMPFMDNYQGGPPQAPPFYDDPVPPSSE